MKENSKNLIIQTALELFAQEGYNNTTISRIAKRAGIAQGLMYNYFTSKEELLQAIFVEGIQQVLDSMRAYQEEENPRKAICRHIEFTFTLVEQQRNFWKLLHAIRLQNSALIMSIPQVVDLQQFIQNTLANNFQKLNLPNPDLEAQIFFALIDGIVIHYVSQDNYPLNSLKNLLIQKYENL